MFWAFMAFLDNAVHQQGGQIAACLHCCSGIIPGQPKQGSAEQHRDDPWEKMQEVGRERIRSKETKAPHQLFLFQSKDWPHCWQEWGWCLGRAQD